MKNVGLQDLTPISPLERLFLDTCVLIYFLEGHAEFGPAAKKLLALEYHALLFHFPNLSLVDLNVDIAVETARIRGTYNYSTPDSLLLSAALQVKAAAFVTTDRKLFSFPELPVLHLTENTL